MSISTLVFDFGNVVAFFSHRRAAEQLAAYTDLPVDAVHDYLFGGQLEDDYESGRLSTAEFMALVRDACRLSCAEEQFAAAYGDMFTPNPEVCSLLPLLKPRHRLVLLSNTNDLHSRQFLPQFRDVLANFNAVVLSHEVGARKPDPKVYAHCQELAHCPPSQVLFLDDLPRNVEAARAFGWQGLVYAPGTDLRVALAAHRVRIPRS
jgi:putative hydrolase of the HAD superfamily